MAELAGKNVTELIAEGRTKVGSVPSGGAAAPAAAAGVVDSISAKHVIFIWIMNFDPIWIEILGLCSQL